MEANTTASWPSFSAGLQKKYRVWVEGVDHQLEYYPEKFILAEVVKTPTNPVPLKPPSTAAAPTDTVESSAGLKEKAAVSDNSKVEQTAAEVCQTDSTAISQATNAAAQCGAQSNGSDQSAAVADNNQQPTAEDQRGLSSLGTEHFKHPNEAASMACVVCHRVPINEWEPLELRCKHLFCWGCLKKSLENSKECPCCQAPAAVPEVQVAKKANKTISSLLLLVACTQDEDKGAQESISVPLGMIRDMHCQQGLTTAAAQALLQLPILIQRQRPGVCSPKATHSRAKQPKAEPRVVVHQLQHSTSTVHQEAIDEVDSGCSSSQRTNNSFHESILSEFEQSSRLLQRHLGGCTEQFGEQYVSGIIKRTGEQLHRSMKRHCSLNNNNSPVRCSNNNKPKTQASNAPSGQESGVAALAALAHELLSPGGSSKHHALAPMSVQQ